MPPDTNRQRAGRPGVDESGVAAARERPQLVFFFAPTSGRCRRVNAFLALVLQRRRNHETFEIKRVSVDEQPEIAERFGVTRVPTIVVVEDRRIQARLEDPKGRSAIEEALRPWLR